MDLSAQTDLRVVLCDPALAQAFLRYLEAADMSDPLALWLAELEFRKSPSQTAGRRIVEQFLEPRGERFVPLPGPSLPAAAAAAVEACEPDPFLAVRRAVVDMLVDIVPAFRKSARCPSFQFSAARSSLAKQGPADARRDPFPDVPLPRPMRVGDELSSSSDDEGGPGGGRVQRSAVCQVS